MVRLDKILPIYVMRCSIWYQLHNLKKRENHPWRSAAFSEDKSGNLQLY